MMRRCVGRGANNVLVIFGVLGCLQMCVCVLRSLVLSLRTLLSMSADDCGYEALKPVHRQFPQHFLTLRMRAAPR